MAGCKKCKVIFQPPEGSTEDPPFCTKCAEEVRAKQLERDKAKKEKAQKESQPKEEGKKDGKQEGKEEADSPEAQLAALQKSFQGESSAIQGCAQLLKDSKGVQPAVLVKALGATRDAVSKIPGAKPDQLLCVFIEAFSRGSSVVLGGSRVKSYFTGKPMHRESGHESGLGASDLDIGYGNLNVGQASMVNQKAHGMGPPPIEQFLILEGKQSKTFGKLPAPEEFFHKTGERPKDDPKSKIEPVATPSGCITYCPDGTIQENGPDVKPDKLVIPKSGRKPPSHNLD